MNPCMANGKFFWLQHLTNASAAPAQSWVDLCGTHQGSHKLCVLETIFFFLELLFPQEQTSYMKKPVPIAASRF